MNKLYGYIKLKALIELKKKRNNFLMDTEEDVSILKRKTDVGKMDFFDSYEEFADLVRNMENGDRKIFVSLVKESNLQNYFMFEYIKPKDNILYLEKDNDKVKCTFNKELKKVR